MAAEPYTAAVQIAAAPEVVFDYFTRPDLLVRWMGTNAVLDPRPGGEFALDVYRISVRGHYIEVDRPNRLVIAWGHEGSAVLPPGASTVEVTLTRNANGTRVVLAHRDLPEVEAPKHAEGWQHFLDRLRVLGTGADPGPDPWRTPSARYQGDQR
ncbi:MAG TPA: SRPBCC family protein [Candidatus Nitrosopolaris sp.]|nr:SRPBCC family protein [Candidatus Nitrosopolaris sp.]